jgi:cytochrome c-type biogenesis protein CcmH
MTTGRASIRLVLLMGLLLPQFAAAAIDAYTFPDDTMRARYNELIAELRCPQCLNTNIAGSDAMIAQDLRREVHRLLLEGKSNDEVLDFMHSRYGDFILYKPRVTASTLVLWFGPLLLLLIAVVVVFRLVGRSRHTATELGADEAARLKRLLADK